MNGRAAAVGKVSRRDEAAVALRARPVERTIELSMLLSAVFSILITTGIVYVLVTEAAPFFRQVSLWEFLTDTQWTPLFADKHFGILPLLCGTLMTTGIAILVALPLGTAIAIWLSEFARPGVREVVKPILELLSAVPTVVFGYFAVQLVSPGLQMLIRDLNLFNMLAAGLVMGIMIVPYVTSLSEDAMRAVPMLLREGSYGMGAGQVTTAFRVVFPAALSGIGAAYTLAISRAVGETMIVAIAAGTQPNLTWNPLEGAATISAYIVQVSMGDLPHGSLEYQTIFAAGIALFLMTLVLNLLSVILRARYRQAY
ncbi:MAG: phosphate ABC transporter permease subunit PstC [Phycisphaerae bacterium]|nr:phosphate ABC transporter permease subunit PstC [Phycisphaerae bacterium]